MGKKKIKACPPKTAEDNGMEETWSCRAHFERGARAALEAYAAKRHAGNASWKHMHEISL